MHRINRISAAVFGAGCGFAVAANSIASHDASIRRHLTLARLSENRPLASAAARRGSLVPAAASTEPQRYPLEGAGEGFEYRKCEDGQHRLFHAQSGSQLTGENLEAYTQGDYGPLAEATTGHIHSVLVSELGLTWLDLPHGALGNRVLASSDLGTNADTLLVLMPGSGAVRAGVWGRNLCVSDSLEHGSSVEWVREAFTRGWSVVSFDP